MPIVPHIPTYLKAVNQPRLAMDLIYLAKDPLLCRTLNHSLPGHTKSTLQMADDYIMKCLAGLGFGFEQVAVPVQAFQADHTVPHGFRKPLPWEPVYNAMNLYFIKRGVSHPQELILLLAHKDSQSWLPCAPGAYDNASGTIALMEIARVLSGYASKRSIWLLFCNEEHWPWTSVAAAQALATSDYRALAVLNLDSLAGKARHGDPPANVTRFSTPEGEALADLMIALNDQLGLKMIQQKYLCEVPNDDDGSFIHAGIPTAVMSIGSYPYSEPNYHKMSDIAEHVDLDNLGLAVQLNLATVLHLDEYGSAAMLPA